MRPQGRGSVLGKKTLWSQKKVMELEAHASLELLFHEHVAFLYFRKIMLKSIVQMETESQKTQNLPQAEQI